MCRISYRPGKRYGGILFGSAQDDDTTENTIYTDIYITIKHNHEGIVYWTGISGKRKDILMKNDSNYAPVNGMKFLVYEGVSTTPYIVKDGDTCRAAIKLIRI